MRTILWWHIEINKEYKSFIFKFDFANTLKWIHRLSVLILCINRQSLYGLIELGDPRVAWIGAIFLVEISLDPVCKSFTPGFKAQTEDPTPISNG